MRIVGISDLVTDVYYDENLNVTGAFGGISACNIICNLNYFGFDTFIYGACGNDYLGKIAIDSLNDCKVKNDILILDNIKTKSYQILKVKENNRDVFRSIKYCPFCQDSTWYDESYINEKDILNKIENGDILVFDNLNNKNQYIIDNIDNNKLLDLGLYDEFECLDKDEIVNKLSNKFIIINLNERVEKYLIDKLECNDALGLYKIIKPNLLIVTRGKKGNDFIFQNKKNSFPIDNVIEEIDDSGAGDIFFSVIIKNWLENRMILDNQLFNTWVNDTKPLVKKVLEQIGSRSFIYPMYQVNKEDLCTGYQYKIYNPSGNPTALVLGIEKESQKRKEINYEIMQKYDFVEQVGFINLDINKPELLMAGGEFCGNATRCAVKYYLNNKPGELEIKVSGAKNKLKAGIIDDDVWVDMPIIKGNYEKSITRINDNSAIVKLYGITHVIIEVENINKKYSKEELKSFAYDILDEYNLLCEDAAGVMFIEYQKDNILLSPIVFVRDINTLFYETACGSGTAAIGIYESYKRKSNVFIKVLQPSGNIINVKTIVDENNVYNVIISGKVDEYFEKKDKFVKYQDLITVKEVNDKTKKEEFVSIPSVGNNTIGKYVTRLNEKEYSRSIRVRKKVLEKLNTADKLLKKINSNYQLMVVYGYRSMEKQEKFFQEEIDKYQKDFKDKLSLYEFVHEKIAVPEVSGHPTGGAVDVVICDMKNKRIIDFGTKVHDFDNNKSYISYSRISNEAYNNRIMLRKIIMQVGFAPYDGEWWHFSYGDREWAYYYKKKKYLYPQVNKEIVYQ